MSWIILGCFRCLRRIIYRITLVDSWMFVRKLLIFFIATTSLVSLFVAMITKEDTPWPNNDMTSYLLAIKDPFDNAFLIYCFFYLRRFGLVDMVRFLYSWILVYKLFTRNMKIFYKFKMISFKFIFQNKCSQSVVLINN